MSIVSWRAVLLALWIGVGIVTAAHALLTRRDPRAAWGWIAVCWLFPFAGPGLYMLFGINRIRTHTRSLGMRARRTCTATELQVEDVRNGPLRGERSVPPWLDDVARTGDSLTGLPLLGGNRLLPLHNGEQAYPHMLAAIDNAQHSIALATYIFDNDEQGQTFAEALGRARQRGVEVSVLIDGFGQHYSLVPIRRRLQELGIRTAIFNPLRLIPPSLHLNLRNHRKLLLVDGRVGFTGGMNIGRRHLAEGTGHRRAADIHFELRGPVLDQLADAFGQDWRLADPRDWHAPPAPDASSAADGAACRMITDGPNEDYDHLAMLMQSAIAAAQERILIMTPYFLPPAEMIGQLQAAAVRGVRIDVVLPARNNLPFVHWATRNMLADLLRFDVHVHYQPPPFAHSKLFVIDNAYALIGSANLDPRSLKLNFELAVEVYDAAFASTLAAHVEHALTGAHEITEAELAGRSLAARLRDAGCWLFSPYL